MSIILNIDTSVERAGVSVAENGKVLSSLENRNQKEHATFLHTAIKEVLQRSSIETGRLDAIASTNGPGSYTGLRVGMSSAKGLAFALKKPFITVGTLDCMADAFIDLSKKEMTEEIRICPMIDARRMEVYTAIFDSNMKEILAPCAMILSESSFEQILLINNVFFIGNGALKWSKICNSPNAQFINEIDITHAIARLSYNKLQHNILTDVSYSEPLYVKEFFSP